MLISSHRHTAEDLELWTEHEEADRAVDMERLDRLEREAVECIREFAKRPCYVSVSGGKDSSVLWALAHKANCRLSVWHLNTKPLSDPHVSDVLSRLYDVFPLPLTVVVNWCRRGNRTWHATGTMESGIREIQRQAGCQRVVIGIRQDESSVRKLSVQSMGKTTASSCRPLAHWNAQDIFSYAACRDVPLHPTYAMMGGGRWPRERLRVSFLGLTHGRGMGRAEWEREYYGDVLARIESMARE